MRIRYLQRKSGETIISVWPPQWTSSLHSGETITAREDGVLGSVLLRGDRLSLTMKCKGREYIASLPWDAPPSPAAVEKVLHANLGQAITAIGNLDVLESGNTHAASP